jgi:plasmid stabilization system protein ParE
MKYRVEFTDQAHAEAEAAYLWIAKHSPQNAATWFNSLIDAVATLEYFPERCSIAPESEDLGREIRQFLHGKYRALFVIREEAVYILHIRHGARDYLRPEEM